MHDIQDDSPFTIYSRKEIVALLTEMMERHQWLNLSIKNGAESIVTTILDINEASNSMIIDAAPSAGLNEYIVLSNRIHFEALYNHIRILFHINKAIQCTFYHRTALQLSIPQSLVRLQRRESFRIATPIASSLRCTFHIPQKDGSFTPIVTLINNISAGGVNVTDENKLLDTVLGRIYDNCSLRMSDHTIVMVKLQVRDFQEIKLLSGKTVHRFGCALIDTPSDIMAAIARLVTKLERDQNAKASGILMANR